MKMEKLTRTELEKIWKDQMEGDWELGKCIFEETGTKGEFGYDVNIRHFEDPEEGTSHQKGKISRLKNQEFMAQGLDGAVNVDSHIGGAIMGA